MNATRKKIKPRVLISCENPLDLMRFEGLLAAIGYSSLRDDELGLEARLKTGLIDMVLFSSDEVTRKTVRRVRKLKETCRRPVLAIVPILDDASRALLRDMPADDVIFKPLNLAELSYRLSSLCGKGDLSAYEQTTTDADGKSSLTDSAYTIAAGNRDTVSIKEGHDYIFDLPNWKWKGASKVPLAERKSNFVISERGKSVVIDGREVDLTPTEFRLFSLLASDTDKVFSKDEIISEVWPGDNRHAANDVHQYIRYLRAKIEIDPSKPQRIKTIGLFGYKLEVRTSGHSPKKASRA